MLRVLSVLCNHKLITIVCSVVVLSGCAAGISQRELLMNVQEKRTFLIVDVRSRGEYEREHLPRAVNVPFYKIGSGLKALRADTYDRIILYCEHGPRASVAGVLLYLQGYGNVYSLEGHMKGWRDAGLTVDSSQSAR